MRYLYNALGLLVAGCLLFAVGVQIYSLVVYTIMQNIQGMVFSIANATIFALPAHWLISNLEWKGGKNGPYSERANKESD